MSFQACFARLAKSGLFAVIVGFSINAALLRLEKRSVLKVEPGHRAKCVRKNISL
jgi:hypothetical protein